MLQYDPVTGYFSGIETGFKRNNFEAEEGQTVFTLSFPLKPGGNAVFVNGSPVDPSEYTGIGTNVLTFVNPLQQYDKIMVIG